MRLKTKPVQQGQENVRPLRNLYKKAFPRSERVSFMKLRIKGHLPGYSFLAYYDGEQLVGFTFVVEKKKFVYVHYLAVLKDQRGRGYGSRILTNLANQYKRRSIILDVEAPDVNARNAEERRGRIAFYERNGFEMTGFGYESRGVRYTFMGKGKTPAAGKLAKVVGSPVHRVK